MRATLSCFQVLYMLLLGVNTSFSLLLVLSLLIDTISCCCCCCCEHIISDEDAPLVAKDGVVIGSDDAAIKDGATALIHEKGEEDESVIIMCIADDADLMVVILAMGACWRHSTKLCARKDAAQPKKNALLFFNIIISFLSSINYL